MGNFTLKSISKLFFLIFVPLSVSVVVAAVFYPGGMSYDTLHAIRSARNGVVDSMWPPMVSYVWRFVDLFSSNPSAMHFSQVFVLLVSFFAIVYLWTKNLLVASLALLSYVFVPVILGTLAVIWKDVLMSAFLLAGFLFCLLMKESVSKSKFFIFSIFSLVLIFLGVCSRHNALAAALPLIFYFAYIFLDRAALFWQFKKDWRLVGTSIFFGVILVVGIYASKTLLDNYSLPELKKMKNQTKTFIAYTRVFDVAGASLCVEENLFSKIAPNLTLEDIRSNFEPKHVNLSAGIINKVGTDRINEIWSDVARQHPICFFNYKYELMRYLLGMNPGDQFIVTHPSIDTNEFGYAYPDSETRNKAITYIVETSKKTIVRPWFLYLITFFLFFYMLIAKKINLVSFVIFVSGCGYLSSLLLFGNAGDARLPFYTTTVFFIFISWAAFNLVPHTRSR